MFTGKDRDTTGLYYFAARYYDPAVGRFVTEDTWEGRLHQPASQNRYVYVLNNPLRYVDPTGHMPELTPEGGGSGGFVEVVIWGVGKIFEAATKIVGEICTTAQAIYVSLARAVSGGTGEVAQEAVQRTGQIHHVLSKKIMAALNTHPTLKGVFDREAMQFKNQAINEMAHKGYQTWHRVYDDAIVKWLIQNREATTEQFFGKLNELHSTFEMIQRFGKVFFE